MFDSFYRSLDQNTVHRVWLLLYLPVSVLDHARLCVIVQEEEKLMRDVMRHMLFRQKAMPDVPVPRNDLTKLILASYKDTKKANMGNTIIALAQESFPKTMGMEMKELRVAPISKGKSKLAGKASCSYHLSLASFVNPWPARGSWPHSLREHSKAFAAMQPAMQTH